MEALTAKICRLQKVSRRSVLDTPFSDISRYISPVYIHGRGLDREDSSELFPLRRKNNRLMNVL